MSRLSSHLISASLIAGGMVAWAVAGRPLTANPDLNGPLNPFGINRSPYGEVFAMAMQAPIDTFFHEATSASQHTHHHEDGEECSHCKHHEEHEKEAAKSTPSLEKRFGNFLVSIEDATVLRTNPKAASAAHKLYLRRQVEDKLRFTYNLDPAHYGNYNSLHFFLTEPQLGTRPQLTPSAAKLAEDTIQYCLKQNNDPRPALTAAAAATNVLHLMFNDRLVTEQSNKSPKFSAQQMREYLNLLDHCLARHATISKHWEESKQWDRLSPQRIAECQERFHFIRKIRDAAEKTVIRIEGQSKVSQVSN